MTSRRLSDETRRARFWARTKREPNGCLEWQGYRTESGYGQVQGFEGKVEGAHRLSYIIAYGPIPPETSVMHRCDNPPCVDPRHLILGTQVENWEDMRSKGRQAGPVGSRNNKAKLQDLDVTRIRALRRMGVRVVDLAQVFGITPGAVSHIVTHRTWRHIP